MSALTDPCRCGHFLASHKPIENNTRGACYDPDRVPLPTIRRRPAMEETSRMSQWTWTTPEQRASQAAWIEKKRAERGAAK